MKFCGIDLHSNNSVVVITDEMDKRLVRRRCPNDLDTILNVLAPHKSELAAVVVESTYNWYWLVDGLMSAGFEVKLANTVAMKRYDGLKHSDDEDDAAHLAHLLRLGILPTGYIHPPEHRALRDLGRKRIQLVRSRTQHVLSVENTHGEIIWLASLEQRHQALVTVEQVNSLGLIADVALAMKSNVAIISVLNTRIGLLEKRLLAGTKSLPEYVLLKTIPGIGEVLAIVILLETGDITRFAQVGNFASYARCVGSAHYSNGKKKGQGNTKNGNAYLVWAFIEAANFARRYCTEANAFYEKKKARTNAVLATKALAHKLARASYHILKDKRAFEVKRCFA